MSILFQIPNAMMNSIWMMSILFLMYKVFKFVARLSASKSFVFAVLAEIAASIYFIISITHPNIGTFKFTTIQLSNNSFWMNMIPFIGVIYLISILLYSIYLLLEFKQLQHLKQSASFEQNQFWHQELNKIGLNNIQIGQSNIIQSPITFGWMDTVILLPFSIFNHLSIEEVKLILLHEVAHIVRNDFMIQVIIQLAHTVLIFNPFSYFFLEEINSQRELASDEWVMNHFGNPLSYSKSLYQLALVAKKEQNSFLLNIIGPQKALLKRIQHIHQIPLKSKFPFFQVVLASLVLIMTSIGIEKSSNSLPKQTISFQSKNPNTNYIYAKTNSVRIDNKKLKSPIIVIAKLKAPLPAPTPFKEEEYKAVVSNAVNWIKTREDQYQMVNYSKTRDSIEFEVAEKLLLRSLLQNYQLRKELLNAKLANIESEKEALNYLENSQEWQEVLQYENWANTFLKRHPELSRVDSLRRF